LVLVGEERRKTPKTISHLNNNRAAGAAVDTRRALMPSCPAVYYGTSVDAYYYDNNNYYYY